MFDRSSRSRYLPRKTDLMTPQAKMRSIDPAVDDFAKIGIRLTPGKIRMISLDRLKIW
jgi:hypothetical protein